MTQILNNYIVFGQEWHFTWSKKKTIRKTKKKEDCNNSLHILLKHMQLLIDVFAKYTFSDMDILLSDCSAAAMQEKFIWFSHLIWKKRRFNPINLKEIYFSVPETFLGIAFYFQADHKRQKQQNNNKKIGILHYKPLYRYQLITVCSF